MATSRLRQLGKYLHPYWKQVLWGTSTLFVVNALGVYIPLLIRDSIDDLRQVFSLDRVLSYAALILILATIMWIIRMISRLIIFGVGRQVEFDLKQRIFEHLLTLEPAYFSTNTCGDLINRATSDVDNIRRLVGFAILSLINIIFAYALTLPAMLSIHISLSLLAIAIYPVILFIVHIFSGQLQNQQFKVQEGLSEISELIQADISGMALIKIYAQEANEIHAFDQLNQKLLKANLKLAQIRNFLFPIIEGISYISLLLLLTFGTKAINEGTISIGDFVALIILVEQLVFPTAFLGFTMTAYQRGEVSIDRIAAIFQSQPRVRDRNQVKSISSSEIKGKLVALNLSYTYPGAKNPALDKVNFTINPGETVAIVGPIGCGKSTLANTLPRLLEIAPGQLFLDDYDITELPLAQLREAIAYVPQDSFLFNTSIENNIRYGDPLKGRDEVEWAAKQSHIHPEIMNLPQKYDTLVGERGIILSGGQRQRIALARALLMDASILILDDALSNVDNKTAAQILNSLYKEQGKTVIFISHHLSVAAQADRILVMDKGKPVQIGTHKTLWQQPGLYRSLWN
ncbi:ABC transporter ATP-binding protein [cyanobacterium endosymbiont of Epithemia turgida]|uniref:ABC transporter ATP-binding protein n=1 Tax=cyanobacterium endosymbiont of Epithemia turgida TaxID=718217 RepID=UPI0004D14144|nr:ABC transporter ATP-binding protein [cyanobacterium endosymbiont of Epithemia turgida]BAP17002.1 ABC transporter ATP-binding protein [cyanobacterium endosymbiont of Epithemia turgida isolate EtSB Lake Yunoko]